MINQSELANRYITVIEPTADAVESAAYELMGGGDYTIACTSLGANEEVVVHAYDTTTETFQPYYYQGYLVKLAHLHEEINISTSRVIKLFKTETLEAVGVAISCKGDRYLSIKPLSE